MNDQALLSDVLMAVSDDYESFIYIRESLELVGSEAKHWSDCQLEAALRRLNADGLVDTYNLSPLLPHVTQVKFDDSPLSELWFYASTEGRHIVQKLGPRGFTER